MHVPPSNHTCALKANAHTHAHARMHTHTHHIIPPYTTTNRGGSRGVNVLWVLKHPGPSGHAQIDLQPDVTIVVYTVLMYTTS